MIVILDYDMGNVKSIANMLEYLGFDAVISRDADDIAQASHIILPGVGAFDRGMKNLRQFDLIGPLRDVVALRSTPILGICLGMQMLTEGSEEGVELGLGFISGRTAKFHFPDNATLKIPHMGWNEIAPQIKDSSLFLHGPVRDRFYFTHSYYVIPGRSSDVLGTTRYGFDFCSAIGSGKLTGVQFHPEKSHASGMRFLTSFVNH